jgi:uncharacterized protein (TIGR03000 family)
MSKLWPWNIQGADASWYPRHFPHASCTDLAAAHHSATPGAVSSHSETEAVAGVYIEVRVPADAQVWVNGGPTAQAGVLRRFVSPTLTPSPCYTCEVRASWREAGRKLTRVRQFVVKSGQRLNVEFMTTDPAVPGPEPRKNTETK